MEKLNYLTLTSMLSAIIYLIIVQVVFGKQQRSISATWYYFKDKNYSAAFVWFCCCVGLPMLPQYFFVSSLGAAVCLPIAGAMVVYIGIAANYKDKEITFLHNILTVIAVALGMLAVYFERHQGVWYALGIFAVLTGLIYLLRVNNQTTWIELSALLTICGFLMYTEPSLRNEWSGMTADSADSGPYIRSDQLKSGTVVTSKPVRHWGEPKDSVYGVAFFPSPPNTEYGCRVGAWVDLKRNAIYKIMWGDSVYYVTLVKLNSK